MAVYEALLLNTVVPQIQAAQTGDSYVMVVNATTPALRITQTGTGDSILVEDAANPDSSPFVVTAAGDVGIGTSSPAVKLHVVGANGSGAVQIGTSSGSNQYQYVTFGGSVGGTDYGWQIGRSSNTSGLGGNGAFYFYDIKADTTRMSIDTSGNLGLGVTPSPWGGAKAFEAGLVGNYFIGSTAASYTSIGTASYYNGSNWVYARSTAASKYELLNDTHAWYIAPSGTANTTTITNGVSYTIITSGNQTAFGAADNNVGTSFTATSSGTLSSGTVSQNISFTQAMTLDASGNLVIGDTSGASTLNLVRGGSDSTEIKLKQTGTGGRDYRILSSGSGYGSAGNLIFYDATASAERARIDSSGNFNGANTTGMFRLANSARSALLPTYAFVNAADVGMYNPADNTLGFVTAQIERARITSGGYFKASNTGAYLGSTGGYHELRANTDNNNAAIVSHNGTNGTQYGLSVRTTDDQNDATRSFLECLGGATLRAAIYTNGGLSNYSANNVNLASDQRLKKDVSPLFSTWGKVKAIEVVNFRYKDCNEGDPALFGVIAQQVQPIVPELVVVTQQAKDAVEAKDAVLDADGNVVEPAVAAKEATPEYYGIREQPMYWLAIKALQEAMARIETLEAEVAALKGA
jgi:hypothetical protein